MAAAEDCSCPRVCGLWKPIGCPSRITWKLWKSAQDFFLCLFCQEAEKSHSLLQMEAEPLCGVFFHAPSYSVIQRNPWKRGGGNVPSTKNLIFNISLRCCLNYWNPFSSLPSWRFFYPEEEAIRDLYRDFKSKCINALIMKDNDIAMICFLGESLKWQSTDFKAPSLKQA